MEFAVALPAVVLVLVTLVAGIVLVDRVGSMQAVAGAAARALGRGDQAAADRLLRAGAPGAAATVRHGDGTVCVDLEGRTGGPLSAVPVTATQCAAEAGR